VQDEESDEDEVDRTNVMDDYVTMIMQQRSKLGLAVIVDHDMLSC